MWRAATVLSVNVRILLRAAVRAAVVAAGTAAVLAATSPVLAQTRDDGDEPGRQLNVLENLLLYVVAPVGLFLLIAFLVMVPSIVGGPRYRPGLSWWAEPVWFGGPRRGPGDEPVVGDPAAAVSAVEPTREGGGASARW